MTPSASSPNLFNSPSSIATAPPTSGRAILWSLYRVMNLTGFEPPSPEDDGGGGAHLRQIGGVVRGDDRRPLFLTTPAGVCEDPLNVLGGGECGIGGAAPLV